MNIPVNYFFEIINIAYALMMLSILKKYFKITDIPFLILLVHFLIIFMTNYVLFPPSYMGDQFTYFNASLFSRNGIETIDKFIPSVFVASKLFSYFPIPIINSIFSLSIINFIIYVILYIFLKNNNIFTRFSEYFFLIYPSLALYSALALRDLMVLFFMILFFYFLLSKKNYLLSILSIIPLIWLKNQNALILIISLLLYIILNIKKYNRFVIFLIIISSIGTFILFQRYFNLQNINGLRFYFYYVENPERISEFYPINSWIELFVFSFFSFFTFVLEPLPWKAGSLLQLFQSLENLIIIIIIISCLRQNRGSILRKEKILLVLFLVFSFLIYGLIIINAGTAARYRFPFIVAFIIFYSYIGKNKDQLSIVSIPSLINDLS